MNNLNKTNRENMNYLSPVIKIFGFGGCGCNTISDLVDIQAKHLELIAANTDSFNLSQCKSHKKILLGESTCRGLGTGGDKNLGRLAAEESFRLLINEMREASLVIFTAGMGGGTGSGAIEIAARIASSLDIPSATFVSLPFSFESDNRKAAAYEASLALQPFTNTLITIPNDNLLTFSGKDASLSKAFKIANNLIRKYISGLLDLIEHSETMHIDLSYILDAFQSQDGIFISTGEAQHEGGIVSAVKNAFENPILGLEQFDNAKQIIMKLTGDISITETNSAIRFIHETISDNADITPIIANKDQNSTSKVSLLISGIGAMPVSYPTSWSQNLQTTERCKPDHEISNNSKDKNKTDQFQDILEIPAFIRKGINKINSYEHIND